MKLSLGALVLAGVFALVGCAAPEDGDAASADDAYTATRFEVDDVSEHTATRIVYATYDKTVLVRASQPVTAARVFSAILRSNATGANGLCPTCRSATREGEQNDGEGHIHADGAGPSEIPMPEILTGHVELDMTSDTTAELHMGSITNGLDATITATQTSPTEITITEKGITTGAFPETFAQLHNHYFDLRGALERNLR